jgi:hypothetical protein
MIAAGIVAEGHATKFWIDEKLAHAATRTGCPLLRVPFPSGSRNSVD